MAQRSGPSSEEDKAGSRPQAPSPAAAGSHGGGPKEGSPGSSSFETEESGRTSDEKAEDTDVTVGEKVEEGGGAGDRDRDRDESEDESAPLLQGLVLLPAVPAGAGSVQGYR